MFIPENLDIPKQHLDMTFAIRATDTDYRDRLQPFALFSYMQEAAYYHAKQLGLGSDYLGQQALCWILVRVSVRLRDLPRWGSQVTLRTWQRGVRRLTFTRDFALYESDGSLLGFASSEWLIADTKQHRPQRPDRVLPADKIPELQPPVFQIHMPRLQDLASDDMKKPVLFRYADYSDIDRNYHVNNTRYTAWAIDAMAARMAENYPMMSPEALFAMTGFDIQFVNEVTYRQKVSLYAHLVPTAAENLNTGHQISCEDRCQAVSQALTGYIQGHSESDGKTVFRARITVDLPYQAFMADPS